MDLSYHTNYWESSELKREFILFLTATFGLDLSLWDRLGFWDRRYRPFSFFDDRTLVSNVCVYSMDMMVRGERRKVAQLSAVGTLPEYRRRGLSRTLLRSAIEWARPDHDFFYLFADAEAFGLYQACGFRPVDEYAVRMLAPAPSSTVRPGAVKLDMNATTSINLVSRLANTRAPVSDILGVLNEKLLMYHCLYPLRDCVYYLPDLDILVLLSRRDGLLRLFDVVGTKVPAFAELYPFVCHRSDETVEFLFIPDKLNLKDLTYAPVEGNGTHILGRFPLEKAPFVFPFTSQA